MHNLFTLFLFSGLILTTGKTFAQSDVVEKIIETGKTDLQTMHHLGELCNRFAVHDIPKGYAPYSKKINTLKLFLKLFS
jgi:hypothetical protein